MLKEATFWEKKGLSEMNAAEWEALCDRCGLCCLLKLENEDSGTLHFTSVACRLLDSDNCLCQNYKNRKKIVPQCIVLRPGNISDCTWLPETCAYRRINEGKDLYWWHPLVSGNTETVHEAGISIRHKVISEKYVDTKDLEAYIIDTY